MSSFEKKTVLHENGQYQLFQERKPFKNFEFGYNDILDNRFLS